MNTTKALENIEALANKLAEQSTITSATKHKRDTAIREAISQGVTMYAISKVAGISQQAVAQIRDQGKLTP